MIDIFFFCLDWSLTFTCSYWLMLMTHISMHFVPVYQMHLSEPTVSEPFWSRTLKCWFRNIPAWAIWLNTVILSDYAVFETQAPDSLHNQIDLLDKLVVKHYWILFYYHNCKLFYLSNNNLFFFLVIDSAFNNLLIKKKNHTKWLRSLMCSQHVHQRCKVLE